MKIATIVGARPQFVKAAVVSRVIAEYNKQHYSTSEKIEEVIIHTGQHYDHNMSAVFFNELGIPEPLYNMGISDCRHGAMTGRMMEMLEEILLEMIPDWVIVYGDTNSTLAGVLVAKKLHLQVAHVEAGLRSFNMRMPEEQNRIVADRLSNILFCPSKNAVRNLSEEGIGDSKYCQRVVNVGDVMYDSALYYASLAKEKSTILQSLALKGAEYSIATVHRAENTDEPGRLKEIMEGLNNIGKVFPVVLPLHPRTRKMLGSIDFQQKNIRIIDPVSYLDMIRLESESSIILTDSGGVQKEAYFFKKPCITLRDESEWIELIKSGVNILSGANSKTIEKAFHSFQKKELDFSEFFYGEGNAGQKIMDALLTRQ